MKVKWTALVMAMAVVFLTVTCGLAAKVVFEDKFTSLDPSWGAASDQLTVKDGKLLMTPAKNSTSTFLNQATILPNDAEISLTETYVKLGDPSYGSGLVFWARDYDAWYAVVISSDGQYCVSRNVGSRILLPVAWRTSDALKKGAGQENQIKVVTKGNKATIFFNGKEAISFSGQPPEGGSLIGFRGSSGPQDTNTVGFSNLQVVQP
jgi:hypothetical protein